MGATHGRNSRIVRFTEPDHPHEPLNAKKSPKPGGFGPLATGIGARGRGGRDEPAGKRLGIPFSVHNLVTLSGSHICDNPVVMGERNMASDV